MTAEADIRALMVGALEAKETCPNCKGNCCSTCPESEHRLPNGTHAACPNYTYAVGQGEVYILDPRNECRLRAGCPDEECQRTGGQVQWTGAPYHEPNMTGYAPHEDCRGLGYTPNNNAWAWQRAAVQAGWTLSLIWDSRHKWWECRLWEDEHEFGILTVDDPDPQYATIAAINRVVCARIKRLRGE